MNGPPMDGGMGGGKATSLTMKRLVKKIGPVVAVILLVAVWFYFTPHLTCYQMARAKQKGDTNAFMSHIDLPMLRSSLQTNLTAALMKQPATNALVAAFQTMFVQPVLDRITAEHLTPEKLTAQFMNGALTNVQTNAPSTGRYLDFNTFAFEQGTSRTIFLRHGLATWKLSRLDGAAVSP